MTARRRFVMDSKHNDEVMLDEALIEEVSIDGMCGVY
ncbi:mycofactocin precursor MftA [Dietzia timorensis]